MKIYSPIVIFLLFTRICSTQPFDTAKYSIKVEWSKTADQYFTHDPVWRGADGAASIDLGNGKVLWLFSDSFISDSAGSRKKSKIIRNSIAIQDGFDLRTASLTFYWDKSKKEPEAFFHTPGNFWFWTGHGTMIKNKLLVFLMKVHEVPSGLGFEVFGWSAVLIANLQEQPSSWKMQYLDGPETYGTIAGSAAVLKDKNYLYAYGAVEPATHEVYLLRWKINKVYQGKINKPEWWIAGKWSTRKTEKPIPEPLFIGGTEYSVHYDPDLKKYLQIQSFGFGETKLGIRMADHLQGKWTEPYLFFAPEYPGVKKPFMYSAKAHPELQGDGLQLTYNVNSFDFGELIENQSIYFPKFLRVKIVERKGP